jgi:SAM-dependent methyltransferase
MTDTMTDDETRAMVREAYGKIAREGGGCCAPSAGCCGPGEASAKVGYSAADLAAVPDGANLGLGCGSPLGAARLAAGETVLDLGCGGGLDAFLAARQVGPTGRVIGVDMTPDMVVKARANAAKVEATNVEFRLGEIEHLPVSDASVNVIVSNCVVNLSPDKPAVFREAWRVLAEGGRLVIADVVATAPIPDALRADMTAYAGCVAGAAHIDDLRAMLEEAGFADVKITVDEASRALMGDWFPSTGADRVVASATIEATKRAKAACCAPGCCA